MRRGKLNYMFNSTINHEILVIKKQAASHPKNEKSK